MKFLRLIRTEADYQAALAQAECLLDLPKEPDPESEEGAFFDAPITLIPDERKHHPCGGRKTPLMPSSSR